MLVVETLFGWVATSTAVLDEITLAAPADLRHGANAVTVEA